MRKNYESQDGARSHMDQKMLRTCSRSGCGNLRGGGRLADLGKGFLGEPGYGDSEGDLTRRTAVLRTGAADI